MGEPRNANPGGGSEGVGPLALCGGLQKMATSRFATFTAATTVARRAEKRQTSSLAPATKSSSGQPVATLPLFGGEPSIEGMAKPASSAPSSGTRASRYRPSLSDRQTRSLIMSGLVCGITPSSIRKLSNQPIRVLAFDTLGGGDAASQRAACSSLSGEVAGSEAAPPDGDERLSMDQNPSSQPHGMGGGA